MIVKGFLNRILMNESEGDGTGSNSGGGSIVTPPVVSEKVEVVVDDTTALIARKEREWQNRITKLTKDSNDLKSKYADYDGYTAEDLAILKAIKSSENRNDRMKALGFSRDDIIKEFWDEQHKEQNPTEARIMELEKREDQRIKDAEKAKTDAKLAKDKSDYEELDKENLTKIKAYIPQEFKWLNEVIWDKEKNTDLAYEVYQVVLDSYNREEPLTVPEACAMIAEEFKNEVEEQKRQFESYSKLFQGEGDSKTQADSKAKEQIQQDAKDSKDSATISASKEALSEIESEDRPGRRLKEKMAGEGEGNLIVTKTQIKKNNDFNTQDLLKRIKQK